VIEPSLSNGGLGYGLKVVQFISDAGTRFGGTVQDYKSLLAEVQNDKEEEEGNEEDTGTDNGDEPNNGDAETEGEDLQDEDSKPAAAAPLSAKEKAKQQAEANAKTGRGVIKGGKGKQAAVNLL